MKNPFDKILELLKKYEIKHAPTTHTFGGVRYPHWYKLVLYSDGSGFIKDSATIKQKETIFQFDTTEQLYAELNKKQ